MTKKKSAAEILLILLCSLVLLAVGTYIFFYRYTHRTTRTFYGFSDLHEDGTRFAHAHDTHSLVLVESAVDLTPYLTARNAELTVSGEVLRLRIAHRDVMGICLPCLCYDFRIESVLPDEPEVRE